MLAAASALSDSAEIDNFASEAPRSSDFGSCKSTDHQAGRERL